MFPLRSPSIVNGCCLSSPLLLAAQRFQSSSSSSSPSEPRSSSTAPDAATSASPDPVPAAATPAPSKKSRKSEAISVPALPAAAAATTQPNETDAASSSEQAPSDVPTTTPRGPRKRPLSQREKACLGFLLLLHEEPHTYRNRSVLSRKVLNAVRATQGLSKLPKHVVNVWHKAYFQGRLLPAELLARGGGFVAEVELDMKKEEEAKAAKTPAPRARALISHSDREAARAEYEVFIAANQQFVSAPGMGVAAYDAFSAQRAREGKPPLKLDTVRSWHRELWRYHKIAAPPGSG